MGNIRHSTASDGRLVTTAFLRAAKILGLDKKRMAQVIGVGERTLDRMRSGEKTLKPDSKEWELALALIRLYRSLDAVCASDEKVVRQWMQSPNKDLDAVPAERIVSIEGLMSTVDYVDAYRAPG